MSGDAGQTVEAGLDDTRYAIYFAPRPGTPLKRFGDAWLGRDPDADEPVPQPLVDGLTPERLHEITAFPRHYGFHATLQAPFRPAPDLAADALLGDVELFAAAHRPVRLRLRVGEIANFLALVPAERSEAVDRLAAECVRAFDRHRAPLRPADRERRRPDRLSPAEQAHLDRWGYPYVFDRFQFHMTLTGPLDEPERGRVRAVLDAALAPHLGQPLTVDQLALFVQTHDVAPFRVAARFPLRG